MGTHIQEGKRLFCIRKEDRVNLSAIVLLVIIGLIAVTYSFNIYSWSRGPSFGFTYRKFSGWAIVGRVFDSGYKAGFRIGDKILEVNGKPVDSLDSLRTNVDRSIGALNTFTISRDGQINSIAIHTTYFGLINAFLICGIPWSIGILIIAIGAFIFFTTPIAEKPWSFSFFCLCAGLVLIFFNHGRIIPSWIQIFEFIGFCFLPASIFHMCISSPFDRERKGNRSIYTFFPYILSFLLFIVLKALSPLLEGSSRYLRLTVIIYLLSSILVFVIMLLYRYLKAESRLGKLKIRVVLMGFCIGVLLPLVEPIMNIFFNVYLIPNIDLATVPFITVFPLFIGYAIAKHDLFEIDVFIKRTTGYILTTASIIGIYFLFIFTANHFLGTIFQNQQVMTLFFILAVVLFFNPIHNKLQVIIDRLFYRKKYDYKEPVRRLLNDLTFVFEFEAIIEKLLQILTDIMFIENIMFFFHDPNEEAYQPYSYNKEMIRDARKLAVPSSSNLIEFMRVYKKEIGRDNCYADPAVAPYREEFLNSFDLFNAELLFPFITHDSLYGFLSLGKIKSGRPYDISDIETLRYNVSASPGGR